MKFNVNRMWASVSLSLLAGSVVFALTKFNNPLYAIGTSLVCVLALGGIAVLDRLLYGPFPAEKKEKEKKNFEWTTHYFRGIAIMAIMACHYTVAFHYLKLHDVCFVSCTLFFLFISGYLCQLIHAHRPSTAKEYYRKKLVNVISPYVIFSILFSVSSILMGVGSFKAVQFDFAGLVFVGKGIILGSIQIPYWYIPFVSVLFLFSPLICRLHDTALVGLLLFFGLLSIMFPVRQYPFTVAWPGIFYLYAYLTGTYLLGFIYCRFKNGIDVFIRRYWWLFLTGAIITIPWITDATFLGVRSAPRDLLVLLQRTMMIAVILLALAPLGKRHIRILDAFAKYSFTLFFLHCFVFWRVYFVRCDILSRFGLHEGQTLVFAMDAMLFVLSSMVLLLICSLLKNATGRCSRFLIGS